MSFTIKDTKRKEPASYKSLYLKDNLIKEIEIIAIENNTSFNNVIASMIEHCLKIIRNKLKTNNKKDIREQSRISFIFL